MLTRRRHLGVGIFAVIWCRRAIARGYPTLISLLELIKLLGDVLN